MNVKVKITVLVMILTAFFMADAASLIDCLQDNNSVGCLEYKKFESLDPSKKARIKAKKDSLKANVFSDYEYDISSGYFVRKSDNEAVMMFIKSWLYATKPQAGMLSDYRRNQIYYQNGHLAEASSEIFKDLDSKGDKVIRSEDIKEFINKLQRKIALAISSNPVNPFEIRRKYDVVADYFVAKGRAEEFANILLSKYPGKRKPRVEKSDGGYYFRGEDKKFFNFYLEECNRISGGDYVITSKNIDRYKN